MGGMGRFVIFKKFNLGASKFALAPTKWGVWVDLSFSRPWSNSLPRGTFASSLSNFHHEEICDVPVILSPDVQN